AVSVDCLPHRATLRPTVLRLHRRKVKDPCLLRAARQGRVPRASRLYPRHEIRRWPPECHAAAMAGQYPVLAEIDSTGPQPASPGRRRRLLLTKRSDWNECEYSSRQRREFRCRRRRRELSGPRTQVRVHIELRASLKG